jgi:DNA processing protein
VVPSFYPVMALMLADGVGPADCFGLPRDPARAFELLQTQDGRRTLSFALRKPVGDVPWRLFRKQVEAIERLGVGVVTFLDDAYPSYLRDIAQSPPILFCRGDIGRLRNRGVAIVGSRRASARGVAFTRSLAGDIAALTILVASGAAQGIDTAAHRGALERGGTTVAVLGTGLDVPYPAQNAALLDEIARTGCVVSEQPMGTPPRKYVFPQRNRLISAFSQVVVVVEAGEKSGALITARWALEQGRDVGAVPGFPGDAQTRGSNRLIKTGAFPVEGVEDILEAIPRLGVPAGNATRGKAPFGRQLFPSGAASPDGPRESEPGALDVMPRELSDDARRVLDALGSSPVDTDTLAHHLELSAPMIQRLLLELELRGLIERDRSGLYYKR